MTNHPLQKELDRLEKELPSLLDSEGRFALVHGDDAIEVFDSYDDALKVGYDKFGLDPFLVQRISRVPPVANFTRFSLTPCPA